MAQGNQRKPLYTPEQRLRRDASKWTLVQGILAPVQFVVCIVSAGLVIRFLMTGDGYMAANISVVIKTLILFTIMVTGAIWEKEVFGQYLLAPAFFWEDMVSFVVIALHVIYCTAMLAGSMSADGLMITALIAYAVYVVNAVQFIWKLRMARLSAAAVHGQSIQGIPA